MALHFIFTIASNREVGLMRKCGQNIQIPSRSGLFHFRQKTSLECTPCFLIRYRKEFL